MGIAVCDHTCVYLTQLYRSALYFWRRFLQHTELEVPDHGRDQGKPIFFWQTAFNLFVTSILFTPCWSFISKEDCLQILYSRITDWSKQRLCNCFQDILKIPTIILIYNFYQLTFSLISQCFGENMFFMINAVYVLCPSVTWLNRTSKINLKWPMKSLAKSLNLSL